MQNIAKGREKRGRLQRPMTREVSLACKWGFDMSSDSTAAKEKREKWKEWW